ncbi:MAG: hypothetical protein IE909_08585 [Campylobacterales bacterium]|nr:hypothetical protein [Campylobacterales bacterium]
MKKIIFITLLALNIFAQEILQIESFNQIPKNKNIFMMFSMDFCPYCKRQEKSIINKVQPQFSEIIYLQVKNNTQLFKKLTATGLFDEADTFPTSYILSINNNNEIHVKYVFKGFQHSSNIITVLKDKDLMEIF